MEVYPLYPFRHTETLDGAWDFCWLGNEDIDGIDTREFKYNDLMAVPGVFDTAVAHFGRRGVGVYRKKLRFNTEHGDRLRLKTEGMGLYAVIWWDNRKIGEYNLPYSSVDYDFTSEAGTEHELVIAVDNRFDKNKVPLFSPGFDFYAYGGIYRSVKLQKMPEFYFERTQVTVLDINKGKVRLEIKTGGIVPAKLKFSVQFDDSEKVFFHETVTDGKIILEQFVPDFKVWAPEKPHLHTVTASTEGDSIVERFGMRTVETYKGHIMLNGKPVYLKGLNRHESRPDSGPVQSVHQMLDDLHLIKDLGCNFIRCVHYPQDQGFLDLCDELGLLVWQESMGWNNKEKDTEDPVFFDLQIRQTQLMVRNSINHPSVILWGFMNECCSETEGGKKLYRELARAIKAEGSELLVTYASNKREKDICFDFADVIAMTMYPGWLDSIGDSIKKSVEWIEPCIEKKAEFAGRSDLKDKPFIVAEIGVCALYGCHDRANAQWSEEYQASYLAEACRCIMNNSRYAGLAIWQMFDTRSYVSAGDVRGKPRGFNCAGLLDEYRRPKMAYDAVKKIYNETSNAR